MTKTPKTFKSRIYSLSRVCNSNFVERENLGYLAVSLGFYKTLFSAPGSSTSSEIPEDEQKEMGLSPGLIRFSVGLDNDIERTFQAMQNCMKSVGVL